MHYRGLLIALFSGGALGACAPAQLEVPSEMAAHRLSVTRQGRELTFGEFVVHAGRPRSHIQKSSWNLMIQDERVRAQHLFSFDLEANGVMMDEVACERDSFEAWHDMGLGQTVRSRHSLKCVLSTRDGRFRGEVSMAAKNSVHHLRGEMVRAAVAIELVPSKHATQADSRTGSAFAPAGYAIRVGGFQVGAVQTLDGHAVWIDPRAPAWLRKYVAIAAGVLLLHSDLHATHDQVDVSGF